MEAGDRLNRAERKFTVDTFTKLPNLFGLIENEGAAIAQFRGAAICLDLVGLSKINDELGREIGDSCLSALVRSFKEVLPSLDGRAYRLGGDEFLVLAPGADHGKAEEAVQRLASAFSAHCTETTFSHQIIILPDEAFNLGSLLVAAFAPGGPESGAVVRSAEFVPVMERAVALTRECILLVYDAWETALTDVTTGLPNSRAVENTLAAQLRDYEAGGQPFSVLLIDGDQLKRYNDEFGHGEGNHMIRRLGEVIKSQARDNDFVGRWLLGDEFVVVLRDTPRAKAALTAERIRREVAEQSRAWRIPITVSIGVAGCPENGTDPAALLKVAENANNEAKREGKNRVK